MKANTKLNIEYSVLLGLFWTANGIAFNFAAVFLQYRGYTNYALGLILAAANIIGFFLQPIIAGYMDKRNKKPLLAGILIITVIGMVGAAVSSVTDGSGLVQSMAYVTMLVVMSLLQPLSNSASTYLGTWGYDIRFSRSRSIGSLGLALGMFAVGILCERISPVSVSVSYGVLLLGVALLSILLLRQDKTMRAVPPHVFDNKDKAANSLGVFIKENKRFCIYLIGVAFLLLSHALSGNFFIEYVKPLGGDSKDMGNILCFMSLTEIPTMLFFDRLTKKIRCSTLLIISAFMFALKAFAYWFASSVPMLYVASALQSMSYALIIPASVRYVELIIKKRDSVKGQSFTTAMFTLGCVLASYFGGLMLDSIGPKPTLLVAIFTAVVGVAFVIPGVQKTEYTK